MSTDALLRRKAELEAIVAQTPLDVAAQLPPFIREAMAEHLRITTALRRADLLPPRHVGAKGA